MKRNLCITNAVLAFVVFCCFERLIRGFSGRGGLIYRFDGKIRIFGGKVSYERPFAFFVADEFYVKYLFVFADDFYGFQPDGEIVFVYRLFQLEKMLKIIFSLPRVPGVFAEAHSSVSWYENPYIAGAPYLTGIWISVR